MSKPINDGGPAFPQPFIYEPDKGAYGIYTSASEVGFGGMTLRDYFAAKAIVEAATQLRKADEENANWDLGDGVKLKAVDDVYDAPQYIALLAFRIADAMLAERAKGAK